MAAYTAAYIVLNTQKGRFRTMTKKYFPGANTGRGFIGHFESIVPPWESRTTPIS